MWWRLALGFAGTFVVGFAILQVFRDLFHPTRSGALSDWIGRLLFRCGRRFPKLLPSAGPIAVVTVILTWTILLTTGFALIYLLVFPEAFVLKTANRPAPSNALWWCLYYSFEITTTLGLGDIQPNPNWLRILSVAHTLVGFCILTASVTWIVLLFPALSRMRTLARKVAVLEAAEERSGSQVTSAGMHVVLAGLAEEVLRTRVDLIHFPILFFFYSDDSRASLPPALMTLRRIAIAGMDRGRDDLVRLAAMALDEAIQSMAGTIGPRLDVPDSTPESVLPRFAKLHSPSRSGAAEPRQN